MSGNEFMDRVEKEAPRIAIWKEYIALVITVFTVLMSGCFLWFKLDARGANSAESVIELKASTKALAGTMGAVQVQSDANTTAIGVLSKDIAELKKATTDLSVKVACMGIKQEAMSEQATETNTNVKMLTSVLLRGKSPIK